LIIAYVVGWTIIYNKRYLLLQAPIGAMRLSLLEPTSRLPPQELAYCDASLNTSTIEKLQCRYWDGPSVIFPEVEATSILVTTRVDIDSQVS
jgi:hypothetical protein